MKQAVIGVGANIGDRWGTIEKALAALARTSNIGTVEPSAVYETAPVGVVDQPVFLNLVVGVETSLSPERLQTVLQEIEHAAGRRRDREQRWGPRTLDLDLLLFEGEARNGPDLILPHPRLWERSFVTEPLRELLRRSRPFQGPAWQGVRDRLTDLPPATGVTRWAPPLS